MTDLAARLTAAANGDDSWRGQLIREAAGAIKWCEGQALSIMAVTAASGDEEANRLASDIAINLALLAQGMQLREDSRSEAEAEGLQPGPATRDAP